MYNSLKYAKSLEEAGFTREQAEVQVEMVTEIIETNFATKEDLKDLKVEVHQSLKDLRIEMHQNFKDLRSEIKDVRTEMQEIKAELKNEITLLEHRMTIKLGTIVSIAIGVAVAVTKLV